MQGKVFLENWYEVLVIAHLVGVFVLVGSLSHNLLFVLGYLRGRFAREKREHFHLKVAFWAYLAVYVLGTLSYPAYGVRIRHPYFDPELPWATGLFEVKEHWGAMALAMLFVCVMLRRTFQPSRERAKLALYVPLCLLVNVIVWYKTIVGCYLTMLKGTFGS